MNLGFHQPAFSPSLCSIDRMPILVDRQPTSGLCVRSASYAENDIYYGHSGEKCHFMLRKRVNKYVHLSCKLLILLGRG